MSTPQDPAGSDPADQSEQSEQSEVGTVGEEAAKLLGALSGWAQDSGWAADPTAEAGPDPDSDAGTTSGPAAGLGASLGAVLTGLAGHAADRLAGLDERLATGAPECTYCPVCRTVHAFRESSPEVRAHLTSAASSLVQAAAGLLAALPPPSAPGSPRPRPDSGRDFQRIDLDDDSDDSDDSDHSDD